MVVGGLVSPLARQAVAHIDGVLCELRTGGGAVQVSRTGLLALTK